MDTAVRFPTSPAAVKAAPLALSKRMNVEQAFQAIVRSCIDQVHGNEAGVARYHDSESLHQMRVGLRRLSAAFALFGDLLQAPPAIKDDVGWLMDQLGPARDWDVFIEATLPRVVGAMPGHAELDKLRVAARETSETLIGHAGAAVSSARFGRLLSALEQWIAQRGWRDDITARGKAQLKVRVTVFGAAILAQEQQRLQRRGRKLKGADPARRHRVRIAAKRTRYAAEFFASLYRARRMRPYLAALARLQDQLGWLNDAAVAQRLLDDASAGNDEVREGAALVRGFLAACADRQAGDVPKTWKKFAKAKLPH